MSWYNPYIAIPFITWFIAQLTKFTIHAMKGKRDFRFFYASGGMPSAHSAAISALAVTALVHEGPSSAIFGLAAVFAAVVIYDSFGVRRSAGDQAVAINAIVEALDSSKKLQNIHLREVLGHKPTEVIIGTLMGVVIALSLSVGTWASDVGFLIDPPIGVERLAYLLAGLLLLIAAGTIQVFLRGKRFKQTLSIVGLRKFGVWSLGLFGAAGLALSLMQYQEIPTGEWRLWWLMLLTSFGLLYALSMLFWLRFIPARYQDEVAKLPRTSKQAKKPRR